MTEPYEPPPPTRPPPPSWQQPAPAPFPSPHPDWRPTTAPEAPYGAAPVRSQAAQPGAPSAVGPVLVVLGLGASLIGLFALPVQAHGSGFGHVGFVQLRELAPREADFQLTSNSDFVSPLALFWWTNGLLIAAGLLTVLAGAVAVARSVRTVRIVGAITATFALLTAILHAMSLAETLDYESVVRLAAAPGSLYHDAGTGTWTAFAGLAAMVIGGLLTAGSGWLSAAARRPVVAGPGPGR